MNSNSSDARAAIWHAVAQLCAADETMGTDLECFAKHAKRAKISVDDVKLEILTKSTESAKKP
ncbi:hypothetical protein GGI14_002391 [Coemansia sp. S680]|nr:hypothetical protein GGI14_002391 [Coemansia sp. S680]